MDYQEISHSTPSSPIPRVEKPTVSDPVRFMNDFENSQFFKSAFQEFFKGKSLAPDVTEKEKYDAFAEDEKAKLALLDFAEKEEGYAYDSSFFPQNARDKINDYIGQTKDMREMEASGSRDEIISADLLRTTYHDIAALALKDAGLVSSYRLGKAFVRLILISQHLDNFETVREPDMARLKRFLGAN